MVITTTSLVRARLAPARIGPEPDPDEKPPPCSHTMTGRLRGPPTAGVDTFNTRQSSLSGRDPERPAPAATVCGAVGPYASASRVSVHGTGLVGGMKRFLLAVVPPYGMPLKM